MMNNKVFYKTVVVLCIIYLAYGLITSACLSFKFVTPNELFIISGIYFFFSLVIIALFIKKAIINPINKKEEECKLELEDISKKSKEISFKLYNDNITNLKNMNALDKDIDDCESVCIALVDILAFDDINELYGFESGNVVLRKVANILKEYALENNLVVYRVHGNTFAVVDVNLNLKFEQYAKEISNILKNNPIYVEDKQAEIYIDVTIGISLCQKEALKTATIALKDAKKKFLKISAYDSELSTKEKIENSNLWREKIKQAIEQDNITPFYQGIVNKNQEIIKYEALIRIKDIKEDGRVEYILPFDFFEIAIKSKQYEQLSKIVFTKALHDVKNKIKDKFVTINLSYKDILNRNFTDFLEKEVKSLDKADRERVVFEILESESISNYENLDIFINYYRKLGIKIAIDDFGSGYSNFEHIIKTKPDYLKIDGSLIKDIHKNNNSYEMVKSIVDFSQALGIKTIAEFVHCKEVFEIVEELGVDEFQGFYFAKPAILN